MEVRKAANGYMIFSDHIERGVMRNDESIYVFNDYHEFVEKLKELLDGNKNK